jgi:hypothetical protein
VKAASLVRAPTEIGNKQEQALQRQYGSVSWTIYRLFRYARRKCAEDTQALAAQLSTPRWTTTD